VGLGMGPTPAVLLGRGPGRAWTWAWTWACALMGGGAGKLAWGFGLQVQLRPWRAQDWAVGGTPGLLQAPEPGAGAASTSGGGCGTGQEGGRLAPRAAPWAVCAKHLCGAATDYLLRACLGGSAAGGPSGGGGPAACLAAQVGEPVGQQAACWAAGPDPASSLAGLAVATCCHHRWACRGRRPALRPPLLCLRLRLIAQPPPGSQQPAQQCYLGHAHQQHTLATLCPPCPPCPPCGSNVLGGNVQPCGVTKPIRFSVTPPLHPRPSIPSPTTARCGWRAYVGKRLFTQLGFTPHEFELVCWMTGALCRNCICLPGCLLSFIFRKLSC
jgi:hypothetical protein